MEGLWFECLCPPRFICWNPNSKVGSLGGDEVMRVGPSHKGVSALMKETPQSSLTPSTVGGHSEKSAICHLEEGLCQTPRGWKLDLGLLASRTGGNFYYLIYGINVSAAQTH